MRIRKLWSLGWVLRRWLLLLVMVKVFVITSIVGLDSRLPLHLRLVKFSDSTQRDGEFYHELLGYTDVHYYVDIARYGYQAGNERNAFYPLWPLLLRCGRALTGQTFLVGMLLANLLSLAGFLIFYQLCREESGKRCAGLALLLLICWPTGFFFSIPYTESLFLFLSVGLFYALRHERMRWVALFAFLLPLCKAVGFLVLVPLAWHLWERKRPCKEWLLLLSPVLGYGLYFLIMWSEAGNPLAGFEAQKGFPASPSLMKMFDLPGLWTAFTSVAALQNPLYSGLDRGLFLLYLGLLPLIWKYSRTYFFWALCLGLIPAFSSHFMSFARYQLVIFPLFFALGKILSEQKGWTVHFYYLIICSGLQLYLLYHLVRGGWVG